MGFNRHLVDIVGGGYYAAYEALQHSVIAPPETALSFSISFLGNTTTKRVLKNASGNIVLLLSDILDEIKTNDYDFKPFSVYGLDLFEELGIDYTTDSITKSVTINIIDAIVSPDSFLNAGDFITRKSEFIIDKRFEVGANFFGVLQLEVSTEDGGKGILEVGEAGKMSYQSFRAILFLPTNVIEGVSVSFPSYDIATTAQIFGFEENELDGLMIPVLAGEASLAKGTGDWLELGSGNAYNVDIKNALGETIFYLCLCENNASAHEVYCSITGREFLLVGTKQKAIQNAESKLHTNGFQVVTQSTFGVDKELIVARKDDGSFIF